MAQKKRQHFLPEFYLKNFCYKDGDNKGLLYFYDIKNKEIKHQRPKKIAHKKYLYSKIEKDGTLNHEIEDEFQKIEDKTAPMINKIINTINNENFSITDNEKLILADFIVRQMKRTPKTMEKLKKKTESKADDFMDILEKNLPGIKFDKIYKEMYLKNTPIEAMCKIGNLREDRNFVKTFLSKNWYFFYIDDVFPSSFIVTDDPVARFCKGYENGGLGNLNTEIYIPLSSKVFLAMIKKGEKICKVKIHNKKKIREINNYMASKATEIIITRDKKYLERIIKDQGFK